MANICLYKIKVKGKKLACYKLIDIMPLYSMEKIIISEEGTDDDFTLIFTGDCKGYVDSYTKEHNDVKPYTNEELETLKDGDNWDYTLLDKSILLDCDIYCNSKDIDDTSYAIYVHYNKGEIVKDECPKELHLKRGRDYDCYGDMIMTEIGLMNIDDYQGYLRKVKIVTAKVKFEQGCYWYLNPDNYEVNDIVYVDGSKRNCLGKIIEISNMWDHWAGEKINEKVGHVSECHIDKIEEFWKSLNRKTKKAYLTKFGFEEKTPKSKYLNIMESKWNSFALENDNWEDFEKEYLTFEEEVV